MRREHSARIVHKLSTFVVGERERKRERERELHPSMRERERGTNFDGGRERGTESTQLRRLGAQRPPISSQYGRRREGYWAGLNFLHT